jgi:hypothetical protein
MGRLDWFCKVERSSYIGVDDIACRTCCGGSAAIRLTLIDGTSTLLLALGPSRNFAKYCKDALLPRPFSKFSFLSDSTVSPCFHSFRDATRCCGIAASAVPRLRTSFSRGFLYEVVHNEHSRQIKPIMELVLGQQV